ncbi:MAG: DUF2889 domain-containing protein [Ectothiorhodospiraceae bacterium AqS1]|nr:DUF2889 domain-containing protein [Ectothiorhodospiraceae bacterium AqS1]
MPLSPSTPKDLIHTRRIECCGYLREDGLWDIEGHLVDTKTYSFSNRHRGEIRPGEPVHEMWLRITVDDDMLIHKAEAATDYGPFNICPAITPEFRRLEGLIIGPGFRRAVRERLGGTKGCTHLVELVFSLGTAAFQTMAGRHHEKAGGGDGKALEDDGTNSPKSARFIGTCHALASDSPVVKEHWPQHYSAGE